MKNPKEQLLSIEPFSEIVIGNTAIVRAMIEAGTKVVTSYPGSPTPEIANAIATIPKNKRPFYFEYSTNEKVATEVAFGAAINGHASCVFFKSVGLNVAADTFVQLSNYTLKGGMIIVLGDDPGANSSQNEQDNRHYAHLSYTPVFEPATPQEVYTMYLEASKIAKENQMPVILRLTTHVCHAKEKVQFGKWNQENYDYSPKFDNTNDSYIALTQRALEMKLRAMQKLSKLKEYSETEKHLLIVDNQNLEKGIITFGLPYSSLLDVLQSANEQPDILKIGLIYPLPLNKIADFLTSHKEVKILEELDNIIEQEIKVMAFERKIDCKIIGKQDINEWVGEYTPDKVYDILKNTWTEILPENISTQERPYLPERQPQLCPGCGHRPVFAALQKSLPKGTITVGDIGCHTLGYQPPYNMGQIIVCMGHSSATGSGLGLFNNSRKVVAFLGDSTFYHAGIPAIINAIFNKHNLTLVILPNGTTAMTGHQNHAGTGKNFDEITDIIPIKKVLEGLGVKNIRETGAYNQAKVIEHVKASMEEEGLSIVLASHPCMLKKTREEKREGTYKNNKINILQNECTKLMTCISEFGCPSFQIAEDGKIWVHEDLCIGDGSCIQTCESKAIKLKK